MPEKCVGCDALSDGVLCPACQGQFQTKPTQYKQGQFSYGEYLQPIIKKSLVALKYDHHRRVGETFSALIDISMFSEIDYFIPVPLHAQKQKQRGYNQVDILFGCIQQHYPDKYVVPIQRIKNTASLFKLDKVHRGDEIDHAFDWHTGVDPHFLRNKRVMILDDIVTTGQTVQAIKSLLGEVTPCVEVLSIAHA